MPGRRSSRSPSPAVDPIPSATSYAPGVVATASYDVADGAGRTGPDRTGSEPGGGERLVVDAACDEGVAEGVGVPQ